MGRLIPYYIDNRNEGERFRTYEQNVTWRKNIDMLKEGYWHSTTLASWDAILDARSILPSNSDEVASRFSQSDRSFAWNRRMVALFDFRTPTLQQIIKQWYNCWNVIASEDENTVLIQISHDSICDGIVKNHACWDGTSQILFGCIPWCEVWYPNPIPLSSVTAAFEIPRGACAGEIALSDYSRTIGN